MQRKIPLRDRISHVKSSLHIVTNKTSQAMNKNNYNYTPHPIDTKDVALPKELNALAEDIAKNVHEVWRKRSMSTH